MGVLDGLRSRADAINRQRVEQEERVQKRAQRRPDWLPEDWPEGKPYVSLAGDYAGAGEDEAKRVDGVTTRVIDPDAEMPRLNDEQIAGWHAQAELAARQSAANELRTVVRRAGGAS